jgi:hypothetical protein
MISKLIKFVILTRFSKPYLAFLGGVALLYTIPAVIAPHTNNDTGFLTFYKYYVTGTLTFLFIMSVLTGGLAVTESDRQYLFTLPLKKRDLVLALYVMQFIGFGISILFFYGWFLPYINIPAYLLLIDTILLSLFLTSLTILATFMDLKSRVIFSLILSLLNLLALLNIPISPVIAFIGSQFYDSFFLIFISLITITISISKLDKIEFELTRTIIRASSSIYSESKSFVGLKPIQAVYKLNYNTLFFQGRINLGGSTRYSTARIRMSRMIIFPLIFSLIYLIVAILNNKYMLSIQIAINIVLAYIIFGLSFATLSNERLWLSITSLPSYIYLKHLFISKMLSILTLISPFIIANFILYLIGNTSALISLIIEIAIFPSMSIIYTYLYSHASPIQVIEDITPNIQFNLRQLFIVLLSYSVLGIVIGAFYYIPFLILIIILINGFSLYIVLNKNISMNLVNRLVERGFV